jgi:hypothetical protein
MVTNEELGAKRFPLMLEYQKNLTTLLEHLEWLKPLSGRKKKKGFKYEVVGEAKTSLREEGLTEPQVDLLDAHDEGVLAPKYDEDLDDFPLDVDLTSRESCMRDDEEEVGELTHEPLMELSLTHSSSFQSSMAVRTHEDGSSTYGLMEEFLVVIEHEGHSDLQGLDKRHGLENYTHSLHLGDHEPLLLGSPLTAQVITGNRGVDHIPCGPTIREVYAPTYCGNGYIEDVDTSIWDCGVIPSERLLDRDVEHTLEFGLSKDKEWIDELH